MAEIQTSWNSPAVSDTAREGSGTATVLHTASTEIVPANPNRVRLILTNNSAGAVWLGFGETAVVNQGIRLTAPTGTNPTLILDCYTGAVNARGQGASRLIAYVEV